jgi:hypothetical protein
MLEAFQYGQVTAADVTIAVAKLIEAIVVPAGAKP